METKDIVSLVSFVLWWVSIGFIFAWIIQADKIRQLKKQEPGLLTVDEPELDTTTEDDLEFVGWVNLYEDEKGRKRISSLPKTTKRHAMRTRAKDPITQFQGQVKVYIKR